MARSSSNRRRVFALAAACALVSGYTHHAQGQTFNVSWVGPASSLYSGALNWSTNVMPNNNIPAGDFFNVTINRVGGAGVTMNVDPVILNLTIGANAGNQLVTSDTRNLTLIGASGGGPIALSNAGTLSVGSSAAATSFLFLNGTSANISGGGTILMLGNSTITGTGTVTSNNIIQGSGSLGNDTIAFINNGLVQASGGTLTLDARIGGGFVNNTTLEALPGGTMVFSGNGGGSFTNTAANINANGTSNVLRARVNLMDGATIFGGTITSNAFGQFFIPGSHSATLNGVTNNAEVNLGINGTLNLVGAITNNSRIHANISAGVATFDAGAALVTLNGTGSLALSQLAGAFGNLVGTGSLTNGASHAIAGAGSIGNNTMRVDNFGTVVANLSGQTLFLDPGAGEFRNNGTLAATNGGILTLSGNGVGNFGNSVGTLLASSGSTIRLIDGAFVSAGTLATQGTGVITGVGSAGLVGVRLTTASQVQMTPGGTLSFQINLLNDGTIRTADGAGVATYNIQNATAFNGNGTLRLNAASGGALGVIDGPGPLTNGTGHAIAGAGSIGNNVTTVINNGTISSDVSGGNLILDPGAGGLTNSGTIEAHAGANLLLSGVGGGSFNNTGTIQAVSPGPSAVIDLQGGVVVNGGTFRSDISSFFSVTGGAGGATVNAIRNLGTMRVQGNAALNVGTSLFNSGTVDVQSTGTAAQLLLSGGTVTLDGSGTILLRTTGLGSSLFGGSGTLSNVNNLIHGSGRLGNNTISIRNAGTTSADLNGKTLVVDPDVGVWTNTGTMQASGGGILELNGTGGGSQLGNTGGRIIANDFASVVLRGVNINGGSLATNGTGTISLAPTSTATIGFLNSMGNVVIEGGRTLNIEGNVTNTGTMLVAPAPQSTGTLRVLPGSTLTNNGTILLSDADALGALPILQGAGVVNNNGLIRGDGAIDVDLGIATLTINNAGAIESDGNGLGIGSFQNLPPAVVVNNTGVFRTRPATGNTQLGTNVQISGSGTLDIQSSSALLSFGAISTPSTTLNGGMAQAANVASLGNLDGTGSLLIGFSFIGGPLSGDVTVKHLRGLNAVLVQSGTLTTTAGGGTLGTSLVEGTLTIGSLGPARWNLTDHDLVLDYAGATALPAIQNHIATARNGGAWDGSGLTSTTARDAAVHNTTLGAIEASDYIAAAGTTTFSGQTVDPTSVLVKYTYYGDTDFNGIVDFDDYSRTDSGFNNNRTGWFNGDFDYNGVVDFDDYSLIDLAFNTQSGALARAMSYLDGGDRSDLGMDIPSLQLTRDHFRQFGNAYASAFLNNVPEPTGSGVICGLAALAARGRRRRRVNRH